MHAGQLSVSVVLFLSVIMLFMHVLFFYKPVLTTIYIHHIVSVCHIAVYACTFSFIGLCWLISGSQHVYIPDKNYYLLDTKPVVACSPWA